MNIKPILFIVAGVVIIGVIVGLAYLPLGKAPSPNDQPNGQADQHATKDDLIWVDAPLINQVVSSPLTVTGRARGSWYFEASFPVTLLDANGGILAQVPAQAQSEWMTTEYVPFSVVLIFVQPTTATGTLVLKKDNPSGLPEHDDELRIPVQFDLQQRSVKIYTYDANKDKDATGNILCSAKGLVATDRQIPLSQTPIQDTIKLWLKEQLPGVELVGASLNAGGLLTLEFSDPQNKTGGGSCKVAVLWAQIEATAKQFPEVKSVKFIPAELFQP